SKSSTALRFGIPVSGGNQTTRIVQFGVDLFSQPGIEAGAVSGIINGRALVNGRPLVNGRALVNGRPLVNGLSLGSGSALVNGRPLVNGLILLNGRPLVNGMPVTNTEGEYDGLLGAFDH